MNQIGIAYYRKSIRISKQSDEQAIAYQRLRTQDYAKRNEITVIREFTDIGYSGTTFIRPELQEMMGFIDDNKGKLDVLLIYSIDRLGRDLEGNIDLFQQIIKKVKRITFVDLDISTGYEHFNLIFLPLSAVAENERNILLSRLAGGREAKVLQSKQFDGNFPPLGLIKDRETKSLKASTVDNTTDLQEVEGLECVKYIFQSYLMNKTLREIAKDLNEKYGLTRRGKVWNYKSVQYILQNPAYIGALSGVLKKSDHYYLEDAKVKKLIDPLVYAAVKTKLKSERTGRKRKTLNRLPSLTLCSVCGSPLLECKDFISCEKCQLDVPKEKVLALVCSEGERLFHSIITEENLPDCYQTIVEQYKMKMWKIHHKLEQLLNRREKVEQMKLKPGQMKKMIEVNTKTLKEYSIEKVQTDAMLQYLKIAKSKELRSKWIRTVSHYLLRLPYVMIINILDCKVDLLFYRELCIEGDY